MAFGGIETRNLHHSKTPCLVALPTIIISLVGTSVFSLPAKAGVESSPVVAKVLETKIQHRQLLRHHHPPFCPEQQRKRECQSLFLPPAPRAGLHLIFWRRCQRRPWFFPSGVRDNGSDACDFYNHPAHLPMEKKDRTLSGTRAKKSPTVKNVDGFAGG